MVTLDGKVALVAGATRGAGRGIAVSLGEAGATVWCTGRSVRGNLASGPNRPETIDETAEMVDAAGGKGIALRVDHTKPDQVNALIGRIREQSGQLDILVNDIWGGDSLMEWGKPFWEDSLDNGFTMIERAIGTHIITSHHAIPLMLERHGDNANAGGLIIEITDGDHWNYQMFRSNLYYDLCKIAPMRLALGMAHDLKESGITAICLTPGFLRSEEMLENFGVTEENWQDAVAKDRDFAISETPYYVGRAVTALAMDPDRKAKAGKAISSWSCMNEYGFTDRDGSQPDWGKHFLEHYSHLLKE